MINKKIMLPIVSSILILVLCVTAWLLWYKSEIISSKIKFATQVEYEERKKQGSLLYADELEKSMKELDDINKSLTNEKFNNSDLSNRYSNLLDDSYTKTDTIDKANEEIENIKSNISDTQEDYTNNCNSKENLSSEYENTNNELSSSTTDLDDKNTTVDNLDNEMNELINEYDDLSNKCRVVFVSNNTIYTTRTVEKNSYISDVTNPENKNTACFIGWSLDRKNIVNLSDTAITSSCTLYAVYDLYALTEDGNTKYPKLEITYTKSRYKDYYYLDISKMKLGAKYTLPNEVFVNLNKGCYRQLLNVNGHAVFVGFATDYDNNSTSNSGRELVFNSYSEFENANLNMITNSSQQITLHNRAYGGPIAVFVYCTDVKYYDINNSSVDKSYYIENSALEDYTSIFNSSVPVGYEFKGWSTEKNNSEKIIDISYLQKQIKSSVTLYPIFESYVRYFAEPVPEAIWGGVTSVRPRQAEEKTIMYGQSFDLPTPESTPTNVFKGWSLTEDGELINTTTYKYSENRVFYAVYDRYCVVNFKDTYIDTETSTEYTYQKTVYVKKGTTFDLSQYDWSDEIGTGTWYIGSWNSRYFCYEFKTTIDLTTPFQVNTDTYISSKYYEHQSTGGGTLA